MEIMVGCDPDLKSNKIAINIMFDFDEVWNRRARELVRMLGYKYTAVVDNSKLLGYYKTNEKFSKSVNAKTLYQIVNITLALQNRIKNIWATEKINNGLV
jgi:ligand-binding sensor domain-containing protein